MWTKSPRIDLNGYAAPVASYLEDLGNRITAQAREFDPEILPYVEYALQTHGKGLRPTLALLSAAATGGVRDEHLNLAVAIEMIHLATLVHDDIIDGASQRRGQATAVVKWGAEISVLLGDCLFAHALKTCTLLPAELNREISAAVVEVCTGEIMQTQRRFDLDLSLEDYFKIIRMKTGALFRIPCELSSRLNAAPPAVVQALRVFGETLGTAYQIYDDCLDLAGNEKSVGKTLGTDLERGKITLPVLYLLAESSEPERARYTDLLLNGTASEKAQLLPVLRQQGMLQKALETLRAQMSLCAAQLRFIPASPARDSLARIPEAIDTHVVELISA
jgi:octaprenyl-diphosphate synthase